MTGQTGILSLLLYLNVSHAAACILFDSFNLEFTFLPVISQVLDLAHLYARYRKVRNVKNPGVC